MALTLSKNTDCSLMLVNSDLLTTAFTTPNPYVKITVTVFANCCDCDGYTFEITRDAPAEFPTSEEDVYNWTGTQLEINPKIVNENNTKWADGVYKVIVTLSDDAEDVVSESNCFFLDCETSCKVAKHIKALLKTETDTEVHLLHFGLVNGGNCNCNCEELCYLYRKLFNILNNTESCLCCK
jgi:hypothetical protein